MKSPHTKAKFLIASVATLTLGWLSPYDASATSYTFTGTGEWYGTPTNPNWTPTPAPGLTNTALTVVGNSATIMGVVDYNSGPAGGDFQVGNGDSMTIDGSNGAASWTQALGTNNWVKIGAAGGTTVGTSPVSTVNVINGGYFNIASQNQQLRIGQDGGLASFTVASTGGGLVVDPSNVTTIGLGSSLNLNGGTNSFGQMTVQGTLNVSGGTSSLTSFTQANIINVTGGNTTFSGTLTTASTTAISISGGSVINTGNGTVSLNSMASFQLSGTGSFTTTGTGEFQPGYTFTAGSPSMQSISGNAQLNIAGLVAFQAGATTKFDINGGALTLGASNYNGIYTNGGYFNFTTNSTGDIDLAKVTTQANAVADITAGKIRYNDTTYTSANYSTAFNVFADGNGGWEIDLAGATTPVPEPKTVLGGLLMVGALCWNQFSRLRGAFGRRRTA